MDEKILNSIGKLTIEIGAIKDEVNEIKSSGNNNVLELMSKLESRVVANENKLKELNEKFQFVEKRVTECIEICNGLKDCKDILTQELERRRKISENRANRRCKIADVIGFGGRLRACRRDKKMFVKDLANAAKVSESTITSIENYHAQLVNPDFVAAISDYLDFDFFQYIEREK